MSLYVLGAQQNTACVMGRAQKMPVADKDDNGNECALRIKLAYLCLLYFHFLVIQAPLDALVEFYQS